MSGRRVVLFHGPVVDTSVAVGVTAATLLAAARPPVSTVAIVIALAASVPVRWRRRAIVPVALVTGFATTGLSIVDRMPPLPYGMLVCVYTFATLSSARLRRLAVILTAVGVVGSLWLTGDPVETYGFVGMAYAGAYALGVGARAREAEVAMLREQARRLEQDRVAATQRERSRIARDMHDVLGHSVTLLVVAAEAGQVAVRTDPVRAGMLFEAIASTGREALGQIRRTVSTMRRGDSEPLTDLAPDGGLDGLADLVGRAATTGLDARLVERGERRRVPADTAMAVYRIVQEALTNTVRHAGARSVQVELDWTGDGLGLEIRDDGRPDPGTPARPDRLGLDGYGLVGMRERAAACGGTLSAGPGEISVAGAGGVAVAGPGGIAVAGPGGGGFVVRARLPLAEEATDAGDRGGRPGTGPHRVPADPGIRTGHLGGG